jgi:UDP-2,4-diacetamido-2,4,6-trideoxy-beta-L-altropyranose hydrolase
MARTAVFRVDASTEIATGHVMRCLGLADELRCAGVSSVFVSRPLDVDLFAEVRCRGHAVLALTPSAADATADADETRRTLAEARLVPDWMVVDHYALDEVWERSVGAQRLLAIDDTVGRKHDSDVLVNPNWIADWKTRYAPLVPERTRMLVGLEYALIRREFVEARDSGVARRTRVRRVVVCYGGVDLARQSELALGALRAFANPGLQVDLVIGSANPERERLQRIAGHGVSVHVQPPVAEIFARADLALCAGGGTLLELACLGVPALVTTVADNQVELTENLAREAVITWLGHAGEIAETDLVRALKHACAHPEELTRQAVRASAIVDGRGIERVVRAMLEPGDAA